MPASLKGNLQFYFKSVLSHENSDRHSLANVAEAWKGVTHGARRISSTSSSLRMHISLHPGNALDYASKNETLESIQVAIIQLFQKKPLQEGELASLQETLRKLMKTEAGPLIYDYYKDKLVKKGMVILREDMKNDLGQVLLKKMAEEWNYLYGEVLPILYALLHPIQPKDNTIRKITLQEFRDVVVLKVAMEETIRYAKKDEISAAIKQMLLVLLSVHDSSPPSENYARLERMAGQVITPYIGFFGIYDGSETPTVKTSLKPSTTLRKPEEKADAFNMDVRAVRPRSINLQTPKSNHIRPVNGLLNKFLAPVVEHEHGGRRHSIDAT